MVREKLNIEQKIELIKRNTEEIITEDELKKVLKEKEKPVIYWGTAPTGRPHVGYFLPALKMADLLKAGFKVKVLLADIHAALDNTPWDILEKRYTYYKKIIPLLISAMGANINDLEFVRGSDFQYNREYIYDLFKLTTFTSVRDARRAASEVVKNIEGDNASLSGFVYPLMQSLDEVYLNADAQLGGTDQRKIMMLARENLSKLDYKPRIEIMHILIPGLIGKKMSASEEKSKIDLLDDTATVKDKLKGAKMIEGDLDNGVMPFLKYVLMVLKGDKGKKFIVERPEKYGGNIEYENYEQIEKDFIDKKLHPLDLKNAVAKEISGFLEPIQKHREELEEISKEAYPFK